jgi:hypothetical protein
MKVAEMYAHNFSQPSKSKDDGLSSLKNPKEIREYFQALFIRSNKNYIEVLENGMLITNPPLYLPFSRRAARVALKRMLKISTGEEKSFYYATLKSLEDDQFDAQKYSG